MQMKPSKQNYWPFMSDIAKKASEVLVATALSYDDVLPEKTIDLATYQMEQSVQFFRRTMDDGGVADSAMPRILSLVDTSERLITLLNDDFAQNIEFFGETMPVHVAVAKHLNALAEEVRAMTLYPEWKEYYDDIARKLDEYALALKHDPTSMFRAI